MTLVIGIEEGEMDLRVLGERQKWKMLENDLTRLQTVLEVAR